MSSNWHETQVPHRSVFSCQLLGNLLLCDKTCIENHSFQSNCVKFNMFECVDVSCIEICYFAIKNIIKILRFPSNWHQAQVRYAAICCHCFDARCFKICFFLIKHALKVQDFHSTGIKYSSI
jgi:hypothetical protein